MRSFPPLMRWLIALTLLVSLRANARVPGSDFADRMPLCDVPVVLAMHAPLAADAEPWPEDDEIELHEQPLFIDLAQHEPSIAARIERGFDRLLQTQRLNI